MCPTAGDRKRPEGAAASIVDYGRCVVCQLCIEACPTGAMEPSDDWAFGVRRRERSRVGDERRDRRQTTRSRRERAFPPQPARPSCRCRLLQWLRVRAAGTEQSLLQSASLRYFLHPLAALRRSAAGHRTGDLRHARARSRRPTKPCPSRDGSWRSAPARSPAESPAAAMPAATGSRASCRSMSTCPGCPPNPAAIIEALLMLLDRAPQRVQGGRVGE